MVAPTIPDTMQAAVVTTHGKPLEMKTIPVPRPKAGEVLIKLETTGVCHTDLHVMDGDWKVKSPLPIIPGHEGVGVVVALGDHTSGLAIGDRVCTPWLHKSCCACEYCWDGWETVCPTVVNTGFTANGSFSEYMVAPADFVGRVPKGLSSLQAAPITCAGVTVYKGLKVSGVKPAQWVVVVGAGGGLGHVAVQYAIAMGMRVIGIDTGAEKMTFIKSLGAEGAIDAKSRNADGIAAEVKKLTGEKGAHGALILVPMKTAVLDAFLFLRPKGCIVPIALPPGEFSAPFFDTIVKAIRIEGSIVGSRLDLAEALELAAQGKVKCNVTERKFSDINNTLEDLRTGKIVGRVVISMK